jgi:hypothetical protein
MVNWMERKRLVQKYGGSANIIALVARYSACILILLLLAVFGAGRDDKSRSEGIEVARSLSAVSQDSAASAKAQRKEVSYERLQRLPGNNRDRVAEQPGSGIRPVVMVP